MRTLEHIQTVKDSKGDEHSIMIYKENGKRVCCWGNMEFATLKKAKDAIGVPDIDNEDKAELMEEVLEEVQAKVFKVIGLFTPIKGLVEEDQEDLIVEIFEKAQEKTFQIINL